MTRTIDYAKCPECGKKFEIRIKNYWISSAFGQYSFDHTSYTCEDCGTKFDMTVKKQVVFNTKVIK